MSNDTNFELPDPDVFGYDPDAILADPQAHPIHKRYAEINVGIRDRGERWSKCANCGDPYQLGQGWDSSTICSPDCERQLLEYITGAR